MKKCDVCGKEKETHVRCSQVGAISFAYCEDCLQAGLEPYGALVDYCAGGVGSFKDLHPTYQQLVVKCLQREGLTVSDFNEDLAKSAKEYDDWLNNPKYIIERAQNQQSAEVAVGQMSLLL
jgi:hypothetical protein